MAFPIISVKNIGKKYKLGATLGGRNYKTLRDVLTQAVFGPIRKLSAAFRKEPSTSGSHSSPNNPITQSPNNQNVLPSALCPLPSAEASPREFWALKDISFDVQQGEVVGIIGRNGAGKSTLLKILSEITEPTEGEIRIRGRVASLLEVGTGFHPELSGRENVYMNGAILGMTKAEIDATFDEIVAFAGVEKFIDTPVKRYSSGMQVRLAFAVAAHLEPEILVVDEVLAVGDMEFQKKCIGQMGKVAKEGRTVLFVSHNMGLISRLCETGILLDDGKIVEMGDVGSVVGKYLAMPAPSGDIDLTSVQNRNGTGAARFTRVVTRNGTGKKCDTFTIGDDIVFDIHISGGNWIQSGRMSLQITSNEGIPIYHLVAYDAGFELSNLGEKAVVRVVLKQQKLYPRDYYVNLWLADRSYEAIDRIQNAFKFSVIEGGVLLSRQIDRSAAVVHEIPEWKILA